MATPLQMALVAAGIANDGVIMEPHVVNEIRDGEGDLVESHDPTQWKRAISAPDGGHDAPGHASRSSPTAAPPGSQIPGLDVGAKTGTAQFGPSAPLRSHAWVIAWAGQPGQAATIAVAVIVEDQDGAQRVDRRPARRPRSPRR